MKKKFCTMTLGVLLIATLSVPAFAASTWCSTCQVNKKVYNQYTGWITQEFVDCTHGRPNSKDAYQTRIHVITYKCPSCQFGSYEEVTEDRYKCYASTRAIEEAEELAALPVVGECTECENGEVVRTFHRQTSWITVATTEDGLSEQTCIDVSNYQCRNCFHAELQEETLHRTVKLH